MKKLKLCSCSRPRGSCPEWVCKVLLRRGPRHACRPRTGRMRIKCSAARERGISFSRIGSHRCGRQDGRPCGQLKHTGGSDMGQRRRSGVSALVLGVGTLGVLLDSVSLGHAQTTGNTPTTAATDQGSTEEGKLEEIVVTAERRTEDVQKTAASLTVLSGHDLQDQGRYELMTFWKAYPA